MRGGNALLKIAAEVESRASAIESELCRGAPVDWASYREKVGEVRGLRRSVEMIRELHERLNKEDDDD